MKILVCIKQVPDPEAPMRIDADASRVIWPEGDAFRMNRCDACALEEALRIRERRPGTRVEVLSLGPPRVSDAIRRALAMGADHGIHLLSPGEGFCFPLDTAARIAACAGDRGYDLILTGVISDDEMNGQVGPAIAELLCIPCLTAVIRLDLEERIVDLEREIEGGRRQRFRVPLPALLTIQSGIHAPRYPALSHLLRSRSQPIETIDLQGMTETASMKSPTRLRLPPERASGRLLEGSSREKARRLLAILHENGCIASG